MVEFDLFSNIDNYIIIATEQLQKKKSKTNNILEIIIKAKKQCSNNIILEIHQKLVINQIEMEQKSMIKEN